MSTYMEAFRYQRGMRGFEPKRQFSDARVWTGP